MSPVFETSGPYEVIGIFDRKGGAIESAGQRVEVRPLPDVERDAFVQLKTQKIYRSFRADVTEQLVFSSKGWDPNNPFFMYTIISNFQRDFPNSSYKHWMALARVHVQIAMLRLANSIFRTAEPTENAIKEANEKWGKPYVEYLLKIRRDPKPITTACAAELNRIAQAAAKESPEAAVAACLDAAVLSADFGDSSDAEALFSNATKIHDGFTLRAEITAIKRQHRIVERNPHSP